MYGDERLYQQEMPSVKVDNTRSPTIRDDNAKMTILYMNHQMTASEDNSLR
jgi:hypothetical protein